MPIARGFILLIAVSLIGCSRFDVLNAIVPNSGYHRTAGIAYGDKPRQRLDLYLPQKQKPNRSIVIFFYGGYWKIGKKEDYRFVGDALSSQGYIAVLPDYRLYPSVTFPSFVEDGALAVRWTYDNAARLGGDRAHIYLMGHSAGAHIAAMIALNPQYLRAVGLDRGVIHGVAGLAGPYDFQIGNDLRPAFALPPATAPSDANVQPITFVDGHQPPMLLLQGLADKTVDPGNAARLADRIHQLGGEVQVILYPGEGHAQLALALAAPFRWIAPVLRDSVEFFRKH